MTVMMHFRQYGKGASGVPEPMDHAECLSKENIYFSSIFSIFLQLIAQGVDVRTNDQVAMAAINRSCELLEFFNVSLIHFSNVIYQLVILRR